MDQNVFRLSRLLILGTRDAIAVKMEERLLEFPNGSINIAFTNVIFDHSQRDVALPRLQLATFLQYHRRNFLQE